MNHVIIVAGGVGSRAKLDIPKQYFEVKGKPIIMYSFMKFVSCPLIDSIVLVVADEWRDYLKKKVSEVGFDKTVIYAVAGKSRQHSVYNGLVALQGHAQENDKVLVHDSVRTLFPEENITDGIKACDSFDAALPVISVKDATYQSRDGVSLSNILPRQELFSGQSPECFVYGKYLKAHSLFTDKEISSIRGSSELAFRAGLSVKLIQGIERNFKITTVEDLYSFENLVEDLA